MLCGTIWGSGSNYTVKCAKSFRLNTLFSSALIIILFISRKQSMPAKLKKIPRLDSSVSTESENRTDNIPRNSSQTVSTDSKNLLIDTESTHADNVDNVNVDNVTVDKGLADNGVIDNGVIDKIDNVSADTIDNVVSDNGATDQSMIVSVTPVADSNKVFPETQTATSFKNVATESGATSCEHSKSVSPTEQTIENPSMNVLDTEAASSEISKKLESPVTEDSNMDISEKSDDTFVASGSRDITDNTTSLSQIENRETVNSDVSSGSEKIPRTISRTVNAESVIPGNCSNAGNLPSTTISEKNLGGTSITDSCTLKAGSENFAADSRQTNLTSVDNKTNLGKFEHLIPSNGQKCFSETSENYLPYTSKSGKYMSEPAQPANFQKYVSEIPLNTELQRPNAGIPRTISASTNSGFLSQEGPKSFEQSVNSTFLKYFPEIPKRSFNSPLAADSSKYFHDIPRTVCSSGSSGSEKYNKDPGNEALVYPAEGNFPNHNKVSSIDFLSSMVENIGKSSVE